jgi:fumarate hydratase, class II
MSDQKFRLEKDSMGEMQVPAAAYWGAQTQRALENFPISGIRFPRSFIRALGLVKMAAAQTNLELGLLDRRLSEAMVSAAQEVVSGKLDDQFPLDIFQTGSGTSTNMNANEVIANRANEILGSKIGGMNPIHPNDHVNMGQSSNDVIPTCMHISAAEELTGRLLPALHSLHQALNAKVTEFHDVIKIGRTHLQDATPIRLGQEFSGYASMVEHYIQRLEELQNPLSELALGGTAVGTGINTHPDFARMTIEKLNESSALAFREADNHFAAQGSKDAIVETSAQLKSMAAGLIKIANDIRLLGSGPSCGLGELILPAVQPGSSIMPGKVNPVMAEALIQVCAQVIGNDQAVTVGQIMGNLELNTMMPMMTHNLLQSIHLLTQAITVFTEKCITGLQVNRERVTAMVENSLAMVTSLSPRIGYEAAAKIAKEAYESGKTVRQVAREKKVLPDDELDKLLDPRTMTEPH